ncbi:UDP-N-acetylmuramoyl-tripeptide--D-alanyl-D-alanine ligase [Oceanicaulis sp. MMSF_3324]|uniref:UDP-N-acetylmuramoyl-tripeptide--D-alanyl-D- alanine ligase n=1 Tax=Oceanicaulis sp. MMSF_3324 TaxID=3046702 RepID=UPI00273E176A|nr:UDP-N-acetylmuramoyl-tripeptide--D-alanyl-D-alanine ligase [Oceanicaulis sp. MMSF_3324]
MSEPLWTAKDAAEASQGRLTEGGWAATGVSIDTRTLEPGDLFVALTDRRDGHDFAEAALEKGAAAVLVSRADACTGPRLVVDDVLEGLMALGEGARRRSDAVRVGVTGSVGKTSVKEALAVVFRKAGPAHWSEKSYNNHWGVPLTLARMPQSTRHAVFEMGMNHKGEISELTRMVRPHVAMITKIAPAHLENLGSMEAIADAKAEIFEGLEADGVAVIPADDEFAPRLMQAVQSSGAGFMLDFGLTPGAAVRILSYDEGPDGGVGRMDVMGKPMDFRLRLPGAHQAVNAAGVVAAALGAGVDPDLALDALSELKPTAGRGVAFYAQLSNKRVIEVVDESYNANPASMRAAFGALKLRKPSGEGRKIAVIGEMLELGPDSHALHAALAEPLVEAGVEHVIGVGDGARALMDALPSDRRAAWCERADAAVETLGELARDGDVVLVKGSNASGVHKLVSSLRDKAKPASA